MRSSRGSRHGGYNTHGTHGTRSKVLRQLLAWVLASLVLLLSHAIAVTVTAPQEGPQSGTCSHKFWRAFDP